MIIAAIAMYFVICGVGFFMGRPRRAVPAGSRRHHARKASRRRAFSFETKDDTKGLGSALKGPMWRIRARRSPQRTERWRFGEVHRRSCAKKAADPAGVQLCVLAAIPPRMDGGCRHRNPSAKSLRCTPRMRKSRPITTAPKRRQPRSSGCSRSWSAPCRAASRRCPAPISASWCRRREARNTFGFYDVIRQVCNRLSALCSMRCFIFLTDRALDRHTESLAPLCRRRAFAALWQKGNLSKPRSKCAKRTHGCRRRNNLLKRTRNTKTTLEACSRFENQSNHMYRRSYSSARRPYCWPRRRFRLRKTKEDCP